MIEFDVNIILMLYVSVPLVIIGILAVAYNLRSMHRPMRIRENIYECSNCGHVYAFARNRPMDRCPRCGHLNEAVRS
jgi:rRNA maturation endonuclease Nob1